MSPQTRFSIFFVCISLSLVRCDVVLEKVKRTVDVSTHLVKISSSVTVKNGGDSLVQSLTFSTDPLLLTHLASVTASVKSGKQSTPLEISSAGGDQTISLLSPLAVEASVTVDIEEMFTHALSPYPVEITQAESQKVVFKGNLHLLVPYAISSAIVDVKLASSKIESHTKIKPFVVKDAVITYGPFSNVAPHTAKEISVHYENNSPFLTVTEMVRLIEVSHWGNIAVEEDIDMKHTGAKLKGPFSRYDYQRTQTPDSSIKTFKTILPASAKDIYYRDTIGNISTSNLKDIGDAVEVEIRPRFPLFGGWKTKYTLGYNIPSYESLFTFGNEYVISMPFLDHIYDDLVVNKITLKIILPEGVSNIKFSGPYDVDRKPDEKHYTYLDTLGRTIVIAEKNNLVEAHIQDFKLSYNFSKVFLLQEPLLLIGAFYLLFTLVIIYVRCDFTICPDDDSEAKLKIATAIEQIQSAHGNRCALYSSYDEAIGKFKQSKDATMLAASRKKVDGDHKRVTAEVAELVDVLKANAAPADVVEKVNELQRLDGSFKEQVGFSVTHAEKLVAGKMSRGQYMDLEHTTNAKKEEIFAKMELLLNAL